MSGPRNLAVDGDRLWRSLMDMARIGATERGGSRRLALSDEDREGRDLFVSWCREAGLEVRVDRMGSIFARRPGRDPDAAPVLVGSHLDTQPTGGRFDGVYGVLAGLEVVRTLDDLGIRTERPVEVVCWTNEEGSRFAPAMVASGVFAGAFPLEYGLSRADAAGRTIGEELARIGYAGTEEVGGRPVHACFEAHIEQGPILEAEGVPVGVVVGAQAQRWYELTLTGSEAHAGTTPTPARRDALLGAARVVEGVRALGDRHGPDARATVGVLEVHPGSRNVVPGRVFATVDLRHPSDGTLAEMDRGLADLVDGVARAEGLAAELREIFRVPAVAFDPGCLDMVRRAAERAGHAHRDIVSGAGHDACYLARVAPTAMVFVPCVGGVSHNEAELAHPEWLRAGCDVLLGAVAEAAGALASE